MFYQETDKNRLKNEFWLDFSFDNSGFYGCSKY